MPSDRLGREQVPGPLWSEPGTLLEHVRVAVFGIDGDDRICYWGPGAQDLFGHEPGGVLARPTGVLLAEPPPDVADAPVSLGERGRTLGYWRGRLRARHRDGEDFDCGFRVFPVTGAGGTSVVMALASRSDQLDRVKTNLAFLDSLFETCPIGLVMLDEDLRYVHLNQALADMDGCPIEQHLGRRVDDLMITSDDGAYLRMLHEVARTGRPVVGALVGVRTPGRPDRDQVRSVSFFPLSGAVGSRPGLGGLMVDVTDRERAIVEATAGRQRLALLNRAAAAIGTTLDVDVTARELVDAAVPDFADASVVEVVEWMDEHEAFDPDRPLITRRIASGTILPPPATELVSGLDHVTYPPGSAIHRMLATGGVVAVPVDDAFVSSTVIHRERARLLRDSGLTCILIAPLIARDTVQGLAMFGRSAARPAFTEQDHGLGGELASRAALCLDNARLYSRVQDIALTLQRALLPSALATSPYVQVAHRYVPGSRITEVGGDWYDVISVAGGRIALVVGDVMGHGVPAAAAMGRLRITAKALARHNQEPSALLAELDACAEEAGIDLATCLYILYDPATGRACIASAGHPPPLVRNPDGTVGTISDVLGVPLGVGGQPFATTETELPDGAVLALYTDGLIEARGRDIEEGLDAVRTELAAECGDLEAAADRMLSRLLPGPPDDDTVLVLARVHRALPTAP
ncbi:PAS domain S-box protein [Streptomyces sp. WAC05374]|uniref:SpoIIE family protein phosphatase n=1 Tax=Streptomyces sp. WAC05374 TaxID=2487420 RepID=UPI000F880AA6|nr:SpoIIE family protein phosphatase [Streptomyces sp. WAC05374]RST17540.1 PAS domain S-box protein [Streptomyces sp. WAC05374]TDF50208.1 PAS domain S-box protein [Streptomyces sp. WAC05374]TDF57933.1 PAS domain S-box protein [Streptomyces sp. WAC05374]TDF60462.1 PAS domain S-box protein [Streptomyces sp. WAC05374]